MTNHRTGREVAIWISDSFARTNLTDASLIGFLFRKRFEKWSLVL